jgi:hypothetical protein
LLQSRRTTCAASRRNRAALRQHGSS